MACGTRYHGQGHPTLAAFWSRAGCARYSVIGSLAGALGVLAASAPDFAAAWNISRIGLMQLMFVFYAALGVVTLVLYRPLSPAIEAAKATSHKPLQQSKRLVYGLAALFG